MFRRPSYRKRTFMAMGFAFIGQSTGVLVLNNYGKFIRQPLGTSSGHLNRILTTSRSDDLCRPRLRHSVSVDLPVRLDLSGHHRQSHRRIGHGLDWPKTTPRSRGCWLLRFPDSGGCHGQLFRRGGHQQGRPTDGRCCCLYFLAGLQHRH